MKRLALAWLLCLCPAWASAQATLGSQAFAVAAALSTEVQLSSVGAGAAVVVLVAQTASAERDFTVTLSGETPVKEAESPGCVSGTNKCFEIWADYNVAGGNPITVTVLQSGASLAPYDVWVIEVNCASNCDADTGGSVFNTPATATHYLADVGGITTTTNVLATGGCVTTSTFGTQTPHSGWTLLTDTDNKVMAQYISSAAALVATRAEMTSTSTRESQCAVWSVKDSGSAPDETAPTPGNSGTITTASVTETTLTLNWTEATDVVTAQALLEYRVYRSASNNIDTVADCETNGTLLLDWTADLATYDVTGLSTNTSYYFNVVVRDAAGNKAAYTAKQQTTSADSTNPTISTLSPADNATGVSLNPTLVLTFSESVAVGTGNVTVKLTSDDSTIETIDITGGAVTVSGAVVTVVTSVTLTASTGYYVLVDATAIDDLFGNSYAGIAAKTTWNWTTTAAAPPRNLLTTRLSGDIQ